MDLLVPAGAESRASIQQNQYQPAGRFPVVDQGSALISGYTDEESVVHESDLPLILFGDHTRVFKFLDFPFVTGADGTKLLKPNQDVVDATFLYYALLNLDIPGKGYNRHFKYLREKEILCPTNKSEQRAIAAVLSKIQAAIEVQQRIVSTLKELKAATMAKLFREGTRGERLKQTEIGEMPESWAVVRMHETCAPPNGLIQTGPFGSQLHASDYVSDGFPIVNPTHMVDGRIRQENIPMISSADADRLVRHKLRYGDILFSRRGDVGLHAHVSKNQEGWLCGTGCLIVRPSFQHVFPLYLSYFLCSEQPQNHLKTNSVGSIMPNINTRILGNVPVVLPPREEQTIIAGILDSLDRRLEGTSDQFDVLQMLFSSTLHLLMTGQVRVNNLDQERVSQ